MKKMLVVLLSLTVLFCICIYIFIPGKLTVSSAAVMQASENGTQRFVLEAHNWRAWWNYRNQYPASYTQQPADSFLANEDLFRLTESLYKSAKIEIIHNSKPISTELMIIPLGSDSTGIEWKYSVATGPDPFKRLSRYLDAKKVKESMDAVLADLRQFLSKKENVYGISIQKTSTTDTLLVTSKTTLAAYPHTPEIYTLVKKIQAYAMKNGAKQTGSPIYNITPIDSTHFQLMAAIPVDKEIHTNNGFSFRRMVRGSFMVTEVTGGEYTVEKASKSLQQYFNDYRRTSMAISFTMLITDRLYQPDTAKWITKLYQPVY
jgi:hypothetical protein